MKTLKEIEEMKLIKTTPFGSQYDFFFHNLENNYISKSDGLNRIKAELMYWDIEAQRYIATKLINQILASGINDFNPKEILDLIG